jgi:hypothetical protein
MVVTKHKPNPIQRPRRPPRKRRRRQRAWRWRSVGQAGPPVPVIKPQLEGGSTPSICKPNGTHLVDNGERAVGSQCLNQQPLWRKVVQETAPDGDEDVKLARTARRRAATAMAGKAAPTPTPTPIPATARSVGEDVSGGVRWDADVVMGVRRRPNRAAAGGHTDMPTRRHKHNKVTHAYEQTLAYTTNTCRHDATHRVDQHELVRLELWLLAMAMMCKACREQTK